MSLNLRSIRSALFLSLIASIIVKLSGLVLDATIFIASNAFSIKLSWLCELSCFSDSCIRICFNFLSIAMFTNGSFEGGVLWVGHGLGSLMITSLYVKAMLASYVVEFTTLLILKPNLLIIVLMLLIASSNFSAALVISMWLVNLTSSLASS